MKKDTIKSIAFGFFSAAVLTGAFAVFFQGHVPVQGVKISSVLGSANSESLLAYESQVEEMSVANESLASNNESLATKITSLEKEMESILKENESLKETESTSSEDESASTDESESSELSDETNTVEETTVEETTIDPADVVTFTINSGENSSEIAQRLESEGIIASAAELQAIMDQWNLNSILIADTYDLQKGMDPNRVAEIITGGAYYIIY